MWKLVIGLAAACAVIVGAATWRDARDMEAGGAGAVLRARPVVTPTTRDDLDRARREMSRRLDERADDADAAIRLADTLMRLQRVTGDGAAAVEAETRLRDVLRARPGHYEAQRMLGAVLLSQHRFADAIREAERARAIDPRDAWNWGVIGDGAIELGDYARAFEAFERMGQLRPGPAAYARAAYALELQGDLAGALASMRMAAESTSAHDAEGQAWHYAQVGQLLLQLGRLAEARLEFERAAHTFPGHPYALTGLAEVEEAEGDRAAAERRYRDLHARAPSPELAARLGDLLAARGAAGQAERYWREAERLERDGWETEAPQPQALAAFLAERGRQPDEALRLAREAARSRRDIHTMDALAWAAFRAGRLAEARAASDEALRTGTRDATILAHAAAIRAAQGDAAGARALCAQRAWSRDECGA